MQLHNGLGDKEIKTIIEEHPLIGEILDKYEIGCIKCGVGTCLLKDVVTVHMLGDEIENQIENKINSYLETLNSNQR